MLISDIQLSGSVLYICVCVCIYIYISSISDLHMLCISVIYMSFSRYIFFFRFFSFMAYYKILSIVSCAIQ